MDSNNLYQNQQPGTEPDNNQMEGAYQQSAYNQDNSYYNGNYNNDNYNGGNGYNNGSYNNGNYNNGNYGGGNYGGSYNSYGNGGYQPYQQPPLDLEEPVKMSEWLIALLLMMLPCVNIVMMFVWAFSKTEKKSKSNFFKAYLIVFGIMFVLYMIILIIAVAAGLLY
ncbi:MAG: hypothetical protein NC341_00680 [Blautia sp.]|nr:hypothetical protein [Blautia sp.]MCM1202181.1 hypothetical protein [Bacteroides fragilis]